MSFKINKIIAYEILDSRGFPTIEVKIYGENNFCAASSVPSGASTGKNEALELRDENINLYQGRGVLKAVQNVNTIINTHLVGFDCLNQTKIDEELIALDGTANKSRLGANAVLGVSLASAKLASMALNIPLYKHIANIFGIKHNDFKMPSPMLNFINGGLHANNSLSVQEFMIVPVGYETFRQSIEDSAIVMYKLKKLLSSKGLNFGVGDEGGFSPFGLSKTHEALDCLLEAIDGNNKMKIALDVAASTFYDGKFYKIDGVTLGFAELIQYYSNLIKKYPIVSIEDPMAEEDYEGWQHLTKELSDKIQIVGDDVFVTQIDCLKKHGLEKRIANSILIKPNQVGTLTETLRTIACAKQNDYSVVVSHRSGETEDTSISHLACGVGASFVKFGSLMRSERVAKYNELLRIEGGY